jgi:hypothetical protein
MNKKAQAKLEQLKLALHGVTAPLTYLLRRGASGEPSRETASDDLAPHVQEAWRALLADRTFLPKGGTLVYPCCHLYHQDARFQQKPSPITWQSATVLKGRDHLREGTELPFGGPATAVMTGIGVQNGDTFNLQWAYLRDKPPTSPTIGNASPAAPPLPWVNRDAVLRRDAEIRVLREDTQRVRSISLPLQEGRGDDSRQAVSTRRKGE